jgi:hypothetical protein
MPTLLRTLSRIARSAVFCSRGAPYVDNAERSQLSPDKSESACIDAKMPR